MAPKQEYIKAAKKLYMEDIISSADVLKSLMLVTPAEVALVNANNWTKIKRMQDDLQTKTPCSSSQADA